MSALKEHSHGVNTNNLGYVSSEI